MLQKIVRNPAALLAFTGAACSLVVAAGVPLTADLREAIIGFMSALLGLIGVFALQTTPDEKVVTKLDGHGQEVAAQASPLVNGTPVIHTAALPLEPEAGE